MKSVDIQAAKTHFSRLVQEAASGKQIVISKAGHPVAKLVAFAAKTKPRRLGSLKGRIWMNPDFDAPLPRDLQRAFGMIK